jgi:hypothetical protein
VGRLYHRFPPNDFKAGSTARRILVLVGGSACCKRFANGLTAVSGAGYWAILTEDFFFKLMHAAGELEVRSLHGLGVDGVLNTVDFDLKAVDEVR